MADAERVALLLNNFAVAGNLSRVPYPYHLSDAKAYLKLRRPDAPPDETGFAIDLEGVGFIGQVGYHTDVHGHTVLGYYLGQPFWGRGIMTRRSRRSSAGISRSPMPATSGPASSTSTRPRSPSRRSSALPRSAPRSSLALRGARRCVISTPN